MIRSALAVLVLLGTAGCGMRSDPPPLPPSSTLVLLVIAGLASIVVAYFLTVRRPAHGQRRPRRALFFVAAFSITMTWALFTVTDGADSLTHRLRPSAAALVWGSFLYLRFRLALDERPSLWIARIGALLAVVQVPIWWISIWVEIDGIDVWRIAGSLAVLAGAAAHATYLLLASVDAGRRWLVRLLLAADVVGLAIVLTTGWLWAGSVGAGVRSFLQVLYGVILTGTALVEVRRLDEARKARDPSPGG